MPAHIGLKGNEEADNLAKKAIEQETVDIQIPLDQKLNQLSKRIYGNYGSSYGTKIPKVGICIKFSQHRVREEYQDGAELRRTLQGYDWGIQGWTIQCI